MARLLLSVFALVIAVSLMAQVSEEERINQLQEKILQQQKVLQDLEGKLQAREEKTVVYTEEMVKQYLATPMAEEGEGVTAGYNGGFFVQSPDGDFVFKVNGFIRTHAFFYEANTTTNNAFRLTEARVDFNAYLFQDWHVRIRPDFAADSNILRDTYIEYLGMDCLKFRVGAWILPFSLEIATDPADTLAIGLSPFTTSIVSRDVGVSIFGNGIPFTQSEFLANHFSYMVGAFNGNGLNRVDTEDGKMFLGNITLYPLGRKENVFIQFGALVNERGFVEDGSKVSLWGLRGHEVFGRDLPGGGADVDDTNGRQVGFSAGLRYRKDGLRIESDFVYMHQRRKDGGEFAENLSTLTMWGVSLGASYFIPVNEKNKDMGLEPVLKFSFTDVEDNTGDGTGSASYLGSPSDVTGQDVWEFVVGSKFHFNKHVRLDFNWVMYDLAKTRGLTNNDSGKGGGLIHGFIFQSVIKW